MNVKDKDIRPLHCAYFHSTLLTHSYPFQHKSKPNLTSRFPITKFFSRWSFLINQSASFVARWTSTFLWNVRAWAEGEKWSQVLTKAFVEGRNNFRSSLIAFFECAKYFCDKQSHIKNKLFDNYVVGKMKNYLFCIMSRNLFLCSNFIFVLFLQI